MLPELLTSIPGPRSKTLAAELRAHESRNVTYVSPGFPVFWDRAHGVNVWDVDGNRFLDLTSGFGVASLGYTPEPIVHATLDQAARLYHAMGDVHPTAEKVALCRKLSQLTFEKWDLGPGKAILTNSGSEAVEAALKTAFLATKRRGVLAFTGGYHGLGYGALTVTGRSMFRDPFSAQLADFATFLPFPDCQHCPFGATAREPAACLPECLNTFLVQTENLLRKGDIGAILVEPVQGRGGEVVPPGWFLPLLRSLASQFGALLIFDEIYTGFHRTGRRFACDRWMSGPTSSAWARRSPADFPSPPAWAAKKSWTRRGPNRPAKRSTPARSWAIRWGAGWRWPHSRCSKPSRGASAWKSWELTWRKACAGSGPPQSAGAGRAA